ncbi:hypothetical protein GQR58_003739 [Nymphon striatum]|nr:hypothetical protein GQR58_003739 [Nymphon striatum]
MYPKYSDNPEFNRHDPHQIRIHRNLRLPYRHGTDRNTAVPTDSAWLLGGEQTTSFVENDWLYGRYYGECKRRNYNIQPKWVMANQSRSQKCYIVHMIEMRGKAWSAKFVNKHATDDDDDVMARIRFKNSLFINQNNNIKFTIEKESQNNISFLDINIHKALNFQTSIHRKLTFTGLVEMERAEERKRRRNREDICKYRLRKQKMAQEEQERECLL